MNNDCSGPLAPLAVNSMTTPQSSMPVRRLWPRGFPGFAAATVLLSVAAAWLLNVVFTGPGDRQAIAVSAAVALVVQLGAFPVVRSLAGRNLMLGWGAGAFVRVLSLAAYTVAAAKVLLLPLTAALISLFVFYFLSMLVEPLFLRP